MPSHCSHDSPRLAPLFPYRHGCVSTVDPARNERSPSPREPYTQERSLRRHTVGRTSRESSSLVVAPPDSEAGAHANGQRGFPSIAPRSYTAAAKSTFADRRSDFAASMMNSAPYFAHERNDLLRSVPGVGKALLIVARATARASCPNRKQMPPWLVWRRLTATATASAQPLNPRMCAHTACPVHGDGGRESAAIRTQGFLPAASCASAASTSNTYRLHAQAHRHFQRHAPHQNSVANNRTADLLFSFMGAVSEHGCC